MRVVLKALALPEFGLPQTEPRLPPEIYARRIERVRAAFLEAGYDALLVYGDREHYANIAYLTAYDPRFEEALFVLPKVGEGTLMIGNEGLAYASISPLPLRRVLFQSFSLVNQPRGTNAPLPDLLQAAGIRHGMRVGIAGWKYFTPQDTDHPDGWIEAPAYLADTLRAMGCVISNASALFMHPSRGLRAVNEVEQLAVFEYAATHSSQSVREVIFGIRAGMSEYEACRLMGLNGMPLSAHPLLLSGERTRLGLASPSSRVIRHGDPVFTNLALWGANTARGGFLVEDAAGLPEEIRDYVEKLVAPYFRAVTAWYEIVGIGVTGGELYDVIHQYLGDPFFGVSLNPGHLIHLDEWVSSPIYAGSTERLASGMTLQVDVIPATGTAYHTTNIEDGIALADEPLREAFAERYPEAWTRIQARRDFMQEALGIQLKPEVLPFSNLPAYLPPFWLSPHRAMALEQ